MLGYDNIKIGDNVAIEQSTKKIKEVHGLTVPGNFVKRCLGREQTSAVIRPHGLTKLHPGI